MITNHINIRPAKSPTRSSSPDFWRNTLILMLLILFSTVQVLAQDDMPVAQTSTAIPQSTGNEPVSYPRIFFRLYHPNTALDMVRQLPGFQLDDGDTLRGFGNAAGNILINGRRPSIKQDTPSAILSRIPADQVVRIDIIRGQMRGLDLQGQSIVANIILDQDLAAVIRWEASLRKHALVKTLRPEINLSLSDQWAGIDYNVGVSGFRAGFGDNGRGYIFDGSQAHIENRFDDSSVINHTANAYLNASTWLGDTIVQLNGKLGHSDRYELTNSRRTTLLPTETSRFELFGDDNVSRNIEVGLDAEKRLQRHLLGKAIFLFYQRNQHTKFDQRIINSSGIQTLYRIEDTDTETTEIISRLEFDWIRWASHALQADIEMAYNALANLLAQTQDTGSGPVVVHVPVSNSHVDEVRWSFSLKDTWTTGPWSIDYGLEFETSTISQSGDADQKRRFSFIKPLGLITYSPNRLSQTRFRLAREVAQLDFRDFVSATVFLDDDLILGNPDLKPESTWSAELSHEQRFGQLGVVTLTVFHDWITDVLDLLPITMLSEAPGNTGDGRRWGLQIDGTLPLGQLGLSGAKLNIRARLQDSSVRDPVTGQTRKLTAAGGFNGVPTALPFQNENNYSYQISYRQDFENALIAWGWKLDKRGQRSRFKVNELDIYNEKHPVLDLFVETTRWMGIKIQLEINNLLDLTANRQRTIYLGQRNLSPVDRFELRDHTVGRRYTVYLSGSF